MNRRTSYFFIVTIMLLASANNAHAQLEDKWLRDAPGYERAIQLQRDLNVPLVIYFYADWCPYCRDLDSQYLTSPVVKQYLARVLKVRINPDHGRPEKVLAKEYGIDGYPTFYVIPKPEAGPRDVQPFRKGGANLTPAQFADACAKAASLPPLRIAPRTTKVVAPAAVTNNATGPNKVVPEPEVDASLPSLDFILTRYVIAIGGKEVQSKLTSRVSRGRVDVVGQSFGGRLEVYAKAPNKTLTVMNAEPIGSYKRAFDGRAGWNFSDKFGVENTVGFELASLAADADFYREIRLRELYPKMKLLDKVRDGVHDVYRVEAIPRGGAPEILYFDVGSGLLIRRDIPRQTTQGTGNAEFYYSDWRVVDGVKIPFRITELLPSAKYIFTLEDVKHNVVVEESLFQKPASK